MATRLLIIVGAGPGIGQSAARQFGTRGFTVALVARRGQALVDLADELKAANIPCLHRVADSADEAGLSTALGQIQAEAGVPEVLLYNAAHIKWKKLLDDTAAGLTADFAVNVAGALSAARAVLPAMLAANKGSLLFTGSTFATDPAPAFGSLSISKAGLRNLAHGLAKSVAGTALRVHYLNIQGRVTPDDAERSPAAIAAHCWTLHDGPVRRPVDELI